MPTPRDQRPLGRRLVIGVIGVIGGLAGGVALGMIGGASAPARAEVRALVAADGYFATIPGARDPFATVALSAHLQWRAAEQHAVLDWVSRESLVAGPPRRELHELSYVDRRVPRLELTLGRFRVPGGFWLIADGAGIAVRSGQLAASVFGGSRSFTNGRAETLLTSAPAPLPLVGVSVSSRGDLQASASYVYTADRVTLYRGGGVTATSRQPEQFLDAALAAAVGQRGFVTAGLSIGSRYLVTYPTEPDKVTDAPTLDNQWFGSQSGYALVDWRLTSWRLQGIAAAVRTKLGPGAAAPLASLSGSFVEGTARAQWRGSAAWRASGRYRLRLWADGRRAQRAEASAVWRRRALQLAASAGVNAQHAAVNAAPGLVSSQTLLYRASISRKTQRWTLTAGVAATAALGDELRRTPADAPSDAAGDASGDATTDASANPSGANDQRAPYTLEARRHGFVRVATTQGAWFAGFDGEVSLDGAGVRALLQLGWAR
ncbi:MAG: hypothetical protein IPI49_18980 [Myxococcales bacterium]|nr:hypothetical protein [Myxococcales bacterium]